MCSLIAFLFLFECHASKNSLLFHWGHFDLDNITVIDFHEFLLVLSIAFYLA